MKIFTRKKIYSFLTGLSFGVVIIFLTLFIGKPSFLKALGVDSGAKDINARYLDGYGTATATSSNKIYISTTAGYMPTSTVDTNSILNETITTSDILNGTITNDDISSSAAIAKSKFDLTELSKSFDYATCTAPTSQTCTANCPSGQSVIVGFYGYEDCATDGGPGDCDVGICSQGQTSCTPPSGSNATRGVLLVCGKVY